MPERRYLDQNPWIRFDYRTDLNLLWAGLGEAYSKCQHLAGTPLKPSVVRDLSSIYLARGALASTAIEGNTLTEEQVQLMLDGQLRLPASQQYLEQEVRNVIDAIVAIQRDAKTGHAPFTISEGWIRQQNRLVLRGLETPTHVVPGEYTSTQLVVGPYKAAPPEDVSYLMGKLVEWLNTTWLTPAQDSTISRPERFYWAFFAAVLGHLYLAWIHPFGDGNGRTARLLECAILANSGCVPDIATNLLSNHYNLTRARYYERLDRASHAADGVTEFVRYATAGFVDLIRQQIDQIQQMQRQIAWESYVFEAYRDDSPAGPMKERRRRVALALPEEEWLSSRDIQNLSPDIARSYATHGQRTCTRDLNDLVERGLAVKQQSKYRSGISVMDAFVPTV